MHIPTWLAPPVFMQNALDELTRSSLGPWLVFALHAGPSAAALVFIFVFFIALLFSFLLLCAGDPKRMVPTVLVLGPVAALYSALHVGGSVALLGWPALWVLERVLGLSPDAANWASSILTINYASVGLVGASAAALVIVAMGQGIWKQQKALQAVRPKERLDWPTPIRAPADEILRPRQSKWNQFFGSSVHHAAYHRIGVIAGPLFAAPVLLLGVLLAREEHRVFPLFYFGFAAAAVLVVTYAIGQLLGSLVDSFIAKTGSADRAQ
jgi:hypothetical protein